MFLRIVVVVSCLCLVKAHIYTINIFNCKHAQEQSLKYSEIQDCNPLQCDQSCRGIGFPGGACVRGHCKCDILELPPALSQLTESLEYDIVQDCSLLNCDQSCRRIGFPGGACVNGHCKCDILKPSPILPVQDCYPLNCDQLCRRIGFPNGACVNGHCACDTLKPSTVASEPGKSSYSIVQDCNPRQCDDSCRHIRFPGGVCNREVCKCNKPEPPPYVYKNNVNNVLDETDFKEGSWSSSSNNKNSNNLFPFKFLGINDNNLILEVSEGDNNLTTPTDTEENNLETLNNTDNLKISEINKEDIETPSVTEEDNIPTTSEPESKIYFMDCTTNSWMCGLICHQRKYFNGECIKKKCMCFNSILQVEPST